MTGTHYKIHMPRRLAVWFHQNPEEKSGSTVFFWSFTVQQETKTEQPRSKMKTTSLASGEGIAATSAFCARLMLNGRCIQYWYLYIHIYIYTYIHMHIHNLYIYMYIYCICACVVKIYKYQHTLFLSISLQSIHSWKISYSKEPRPQLVASSNLTLLPPWKLLLPLFPSLCLITCS